MHEMNDTSSPLSLSEFAAIMGRIADFPPQTAFAAAVSGGADSMALSLLLAEYARRNQCALIAVTVDHGLRPEAANESKMVANWMRSRDIEHHILRWDAGKPQSNIQDQARAARYRLLSDFCLSRDIGYLCLGHHHDDQAENFMIRLARGSGVYGLAAMPKLARRLGVNILRPLLDIPKSRLIETLQAHGQPWIEDPSNQNTDFTRVKFRKSIPALFDLGLTPERIVKTAESMARAKTALSHYTALAKQQCLATFDSGYAAIDLRGFKTHPEEIGLRLLAETLQQVGGNEYPPRLDSLLDLYADLISGNIKPARTLAGCLIHCDGTCAMIFREHRVINDSLALNFSGTRMWDGRFMIANVAPPKNDFFVIQALQEKGWQQLVQMRDDLRQTPIPFAARCGLPAIWRKSGAHASAELDELIAAPHLNYWKDDTNEWLRQKLSIVWKDSRHDPPDGNLTATKT